MNASSMNGAAASSGAAGGVPMGGVPVMGGQPLGGMVPTAPGGGMVVAQGKPGAPNQNVLDAVKKVSYSKQVCVIRNYFLFVSGSVVGSDFGCVQRQKF